MNISSPSSPSPNPTLKGQDLPKSTRKMPEAAKAAVRGGIVGNYIDQIHIFLPVLALAPALPVLMGSDDKQTLGLLGAWIIAATLIGRPLGGLIFGRLADRYSRTVTTQVAIIGTASCTFLLALLPNHPANIWFNLIAMVILRFLVGVFLAGEYSAAIPLAMEWAKPQKRGLYSSLIMSMAPWAQATISGFTLLGIMVLGGDFYAHYGWRILFILGSLASLGMLFYYRRHVKDQQSNVSTPSAPKIAARDLFFGRLAGSFWQMFGLMSGLWLMTQMVAIMLPRQISEHLSPLGFEYRDVSLVMLVASIAQALAMSSTGSISTRIGRRKFLTLWGVMAAIAGPLLWWITFQLAGNEPQRALLVMLVAAALLQVLTVSAYGPVGAYLTERFPRAVRSTGYGTAYSLSIVLPALYMLYLPPLGKLVGTEFAPMLVLALGGLLLAGCAAIGPRLSPADIVAEVDVVAERAWNDEH